MEYDMNDRLLRPSDVAKLFRVDPKTVTRWANQGRIPSVKTPGGHRRFFESAILKIIKENTDGQPNRPNEAGNKLEGHNDIPGQQNL